MHRIVRGVRDPWLLIDHRKPPDRNASACDMVKPRHRAIVDVEGEAFVGLAAERQTDRGPDRSAMRHRDHIPARLLARDALDGAAGAVIEIPETLATGRGLVERGKPMTAGRQARYVRLAIHALQLAEMLLGKSLLMRHGRRLGKSGSPDRVRGLMRALEVACIPDRVARQDFPDRLEHHAIAGVAAEIRLPIDAAIVLAYRRMAHPPPACRDHFRFVWIGHRHRPSISFANP